MKPSRGPAKTWFKCGKLRYCRWQHAYFVKPDVLNVGCEFFLPQQIRRTSMFRAGRWRAFANARRVRDPCRKDAMTNQPGSAIAAPDYTIELSASGRYIVFCPVRPSLSEAELIRRWAEIARFGRQHGTHKVLFDHRGGAPSASVDMVTAALENPNWTEGERWRVAILLSHALPHAGISNLEGIAEFVGAIGHEAEVFWDWRDAETWLLQETS